MGADLYLSFGADSGPLEEAFARAKAEANATAREMATLARQMQATGASADSGLGRHLSEVASHLAEVKGRVAEASAALREHAESVSEAGGALGRFAETIKAPFEQIEAFKGSLAGLAEVAGLTYVVEKFGELIAAAQEAAEQTERFSHQLGVSTTEVQELAAAAKLTGTDFEEAVTQLGRMELTLAKAQRATSPAAAALKVFNINIDEFRRLSPVQQLEELAEANARFADGVNKTAADYAILGRAAGNLIPILDRGKEGFDDLLKIARETGVVMSEEDVKALAKAKEESERLGLATQALGQDIATKLNPEIGHSVTILESLVGGLDLAIKKMNEWGAVIANSGAAEGGLPAPGLDLPIPDMLAGVPPEWLPHNLTVHAKPKPQVAPMELGGGGGGGRSKADKEADTAARDAFGDEMDNAKQAAKTEEDTLDNLVKQHKISWGQWATDTKAALEQEKVAIEAAANHALASAALTSQQKIQIMQKEKDALNEIARQEADAQAKAAEEAAKAWDQFFKPLNSAIESQIGPLLKGTESLRTAFAKMLESMEQDLAKFVANRALTTIESMLTGGASGGGSATGGGGGAGGLLGGLFSGLLGGVGKAAGGSAAGGLGALFSGLGGAGTAAAAGGIGSDAVASAGAAAGGAGGLSSLFSFLPLLFAPLGFDSGSWEVPRDMVAGVHAGEMIVPSTGGIASQFRSFLGGESPAQSGGDTHVHFNVNAIDSGSVKSFFNSNSKHIMNAINNGVKNGDHLGLKSLGSR